MKTTVTSIILLALLSVNSVAQEYMHWGLPEGAKMRIGRGAMKDLAYSPDGARLAIASSVGVWLYDTATLKEVDLLAEHTGEVLSVAYSPDSSLLASGSKDRTMRLWDTKTGEQKHPPLWHGPDVVNVEFSPDGTALASSSGDQAQIWDAKTVEERYRRSVRGKTLASAGEDSTLRLWDGTWELRRILTDDRAEMTSVAFTPDGRGIVGGCTGRTILWDTETGSLLRTFTGYSGSVFSLVFSPDGAKLASGSDDMSVRLWDAKSGSLLRSLDWIEKDFGKAAFHPDGRTLAIGGGRRVRLWNTSSGEHLRTLSGPQDNVLSLAFSPDGNNKEIWLWDARTGNHLHKLTGHKGPVHCLGFSPDGTTLASGGGHQRNTRCVSGILKQAKICTRILCIRRWSVAWRSVRMAGLSPVQAATAAWHCGIPAPGRICGH